MKNKNKNEKQNMTLDMTIKQKIIQHTHKQQKKLII